MKGWRGGFVLVAAMAMLATVAFLPVAIGEWSAAAQSSCGAFSEQCTWNFSPLGSSGGGADVYPAQAAGGGGAGVLVAVVDAWVDAGHPALAGRVVDQVDCVGATDSSGNPAPAACQDHAVASDSCVHGTHVAGTIASSNFGVAPRASILSVQVLTAASNGTCKGYPPDVAAGVLYAAQRGARVINLSIGDLVPGLTQDSSLTAAVHQAAEEGALVVFASGNSGSPFTDSYGTDALLVAATGPSGQLSGYSDSGDVAAPGGDDGTSCVFACFSGNGCTVTTCVLSTLPGNQYGLLEGTSMAAPHVSGVAALLYAEHPGRSRADVIHALEATGHPVSGATYGLIDAGTALAVEPPSAQVASGTGRPTVTPAASAGTSRAVRSQGSSFAAGSPTAAASTSATTGASPTTAAAPSTTSPSPEPANGSGLSGAHVRSASGPLGVPRGGDAASVAAAGAIAALLLLLVGAGTGVFALRRRP